MTQPEETTAANLLLVNTVHHVLSAHVGSETDHRTGRTTYKASLKVEGLEPWVDVRGEAAAELFDAMPQLPVHLLLLSGPSAADTAALIARLHEQLTESNQARDHWETAYDRVKRESERSFAATSRAQDERDEQRARAEKAEALLREERIARGSEKHAAMDAEKRQGDIYWREIYEARKKLGETKPEREGGRSLALCVLDVLGRLDAYKANLKGAEDTSEYYKRFNERADREKARAESAEHKIAMLEAEVTGALATAKTLLEAKNAWADRCAELQKALIDARAESLRAGLAGKEMAENCDAISAECLKAQALAQEAGAKCDRAIKERDEAREQLAKLECRTRPAHWRTLDRLAWREMHGLYESFLCQGAKIKPVPCSLCLQPDVTSKPHPHARCANHAASEPSSTEPRFKVGQRVVETAIAWEVGEILLGAYEWWYRAPGSTWVEESKLKPAPKFAVGEWVTFDGYTGEIKSYSWGLSSRTEWIYDVLSAGVFGEPCLQWRRGEHALTAQTPQHKHDCKGCVFLGRMGKWDLWFSTKGSNFVPGPTVFANGGSDPLSEYKECSARESPRYVRVPIDDDDPELIEASHRAVARGLV